MVLNNYEEALFKELLRRKSALKRLGSGDASDLTQANHDLYIKLENSLEQDIKCFVDACIPELKYVLRSIGYLSINKTMVENKLRKENSND